MKIVTGVATAAALAGFAGIAGAQDPPQKACTLIGCTSGVYLDAENLRSIPKARTVTVCLDDRCRKLTARSDSYAVEDQARSGPGPVRVRVVVRDRRGKVLLRQERQVTLTRSQPNGPECEPTCWMAFLRYDRAQRRLVER